MSCTRLREGYFQRQKRQQENMEGISNGIQSTLSLFPGTDDKVYQEQLAERLLNSGCVKECTIDFSPPFALYTKKIYPTLSKPLLSFFQVNNSLKKVTICNTGSSNLRECLAAISSNRSITKIVVDTISSFNLKTIEEAWGLLATNKYIKGLAVSGSSNMAIWMLLQQLSDSSCQSPLESLSISYIDGGSLDAEKLQSLPVKCGRTPSIRTPSIRTPSKLKNLFIEGLNEPSRLEMISFCLLHNTRLQTLTLKICRFQGEPLSVFSQALEDMHFLKSIELDGVSIGKGEDDKSMRAWTTMVKKPTLQILCLRRLGEDEMQGVVGALTGGEFFEELILDQCDLSEGPLESILNIYICDTSSKRKLYFSGSPSPLTLNKLIMSLRHPACHLRELSLELDLIGDEGDAMVSDLLRALNDNKSLYYIN